MAKIFDGPIPGQSLTGTPGGSPMEKPPQFHELDKALEYVFNTVLADRKTITKLMVFVKGGISLVELTNTFLYGGIMSGKWSIDLAFLMYQTVVWQLAAQAQIRGIKYKLKPVDQNFQAFLLKYQDYIKEPDDEPVEQEVNSIFSGLGV